MAMRRHTKVVPHFSVSNDFQEIKYEISKQNYFHPHPNSVECTLSDLDAQPHWLI